MSIHDAFAQLETLDSVIAYMEKTPEDSWLMGKVRSEEGETNCFFGHLFSMGKTDPDGSHLWHVFEELWATTYMLYPVNDGEDPCYPQPTPKQRVLAYLHDLQSGKAPTTVRLMEDQMALYDMGMDD